MKKMLLAICVWAASLAGAARTADGAQGESPMAVAESLAQLGMENIRTARVNDEVIVAFEDNVFRGTYRGIGKAIGTVLSHAETDHYAIRMVVLDGNGIARLCISLPKELTEAYKQGKADICEVYRQMGMSTDATEAMDKLKKSHRVVNSSFGKVDIVVYPEVMLRNSGFKELYTYYVNLSPAVEMALWQGAQLTLQAVFPVSTNLHGQYSWIRPGVMTLSQGFRFGKTGWGRIAAGNFTDNRMGVAGEAEWRSKDGRYAVGAEAGGTVQSILTDDEGWFISRKLRVNAAARASYYEPRYNVQFDLRAGRYLFGDFGVRGDCTRHFGDYSIGLYALYTEGEVNGGFHFALPLPGKKWSRNRGIRIRQADYFTMEYSMRSWGKYEDENLAETYRTRPNENRSNRHFQPDFIRHFLIREAERASKVPSPNE